MTAEQLRLMFVVLPLGCLLVLTAVLRVVPALWDATVGPMDRGRNQTIDGTRGLLALWVITHHLDVGPEMVKAGGIWNPPESTLVVIMQTGFFIAPFFALTALIFGGHLLRTKGELSTLSFVKKRAFRLLPTYFLSVLLIFVTAFAMTGLELRVTVLKLATQIVRWSLLDFVPRYDINAVDVSKAHGMLWSLRLELIFYLLLPGLAFLQRRFRSPAPLFLGLAAASLVNSIFVFFLAGLVTAAVLGWTGLRFKLAWQLATVGAVTLIIVLADNHSRIVQAVLLIPIMVALVQEGAVFAALRWRPLRFVGEISYSVYILHYPLIWILFSALIAPDWAQQLPYEHRMLLNIALASLIVAISTLSFVAVERPFVRLGRRITAAHFGAQAPWRRPRAVLLSPGQSAAAAAVDDPAHRPEPTK